MIRSLKWLLSLVLALSFALPAQADYTFFSAYTLAPGASGSTLTLSDSISFSTTATGIKSNTTDTTDNKSVVFCGGGGVSTSRGTCITAYGNESNNGTLDIEVGNTASALVRFYLQNQLRWSLDGTGQLIQDATNGSNIILSRTGANLQGIYAGLTSMDADLSGLVSTKPGLVVNQNRTLSDSVVLVANAADTLAGIISFAKTRAAAPATNADTIVVSGDEIGAMRFLAADGVTYRSAAQIRVLIDGTPGASDMPGRIEYYTTNDGSASATLKWTMGNAGTFIGAGTADIGWTRVNAANQACNTTCVTPCVFGWDTAAPGALLTCADATSDSCLCAGAS